MTETITLPESWDVRGTNLKFTVYIEDGVLKRTVTERKITVPAGTGLKNPRQGVKTFTDSEIVLIRIIAGSGIMSYSEIAEIFGVHRTTIMRIAVRDTYRGVA